MIWLSTAYLFGLGLFTGITVLAGEHRNHGPVTLTFCLLFWPFTVTLGSIVIWEEKRR